MIDRLADWIERHYMRATWIVMAVLVVLVSVMFASLARATTLDGAFTLPTQYADGSPLPVENIKHIRVEAGTCSSPGVFGVREGEQLVVPPATAWTVTVPRAFGTFCARARTETQLGTIGDWSNAVTKVIAEPPPKPPVMLTTGGWAWELKSNGKLRVVGIVEAGKACTGAAPKVEPDLYTINGANVSLWIGTSGAAGRTNLVAQCEASS